jgi:glycogen operon protein
LADLVSYARKHNSANGEDSRDGRDEELSGNLGAEGPTDDASINALRLRVRRAIMATLLLAQGTPMLCAGDEIGNSQQGNNNAYCQDNPTTWLDWAGADHEFREFVVEVLALRRAESLLHHDRWFNASADSDSHASLAWCLPTGAEIRIQDWHDVAAHALACVMSPAGSGQSADERGARLMLLFNPQSQSISFNLPEGNWQLMLDSSGNLPQHGVPAASHFFASELVVPGHALLVMRSTTLTP